MLQLIGIVIFVVLIALSIALHELGHFLPAKKFGVKVTEFMIGFGPALWTRVKGETRYGFKAVPLGGYVRMIGMLPPAKESEEAAAPASTGRFATMIADARQQSLEEVGPQDQDRVFYRLPVRKRVMVMLGGPTMNLIFATVLFSILLVGIGLPQPSLTVNSVVPCTPSELHPSGAALPSGNCPVGSSQTPAMAAGIQPGDVISGMNGKSAQDWDSVSTALRASGGTTVSLDLVRDGQELVVPVAVALIDRPEYDDTGVATGATIEGGFVGVSPGVDYVRQSWTEVPAFMWNLTTASIGALISLPIRLYELVTETLIGGQERAIDGPVSVVGVSRLGGDIAAMDEPIQGKIATFLGLAASLNLFLFLFNLLPIPPLDGGHIAGALYEAIRRSIAKFRGRPDPGPVDVARLLPVAYFVAIALVSMGAIVIWADLVKPISLG
ncbi:MAG: site-2 protease family protein [Actinomycetota bacterium]|nr:site-2 protease family protein [Actinomycetota bacterium]